MQPLLHSRGSLRSCEIPKHESSSPGAAPDGSGWAIRANPAALRSVNPIRRIMESMPSLEGRGKTPISLALGDPSAFRQMSAPQVAVQALLDSTSSFTFNGYCQASGILQSRRAVAEYLTKDLPFQLGADDIFLTAGCSQAIQFCIAALASSTCSNVLVPNPGFPLYQSFCSFYGVEARQYDLLPEDHWQIDLRSLERQADENTVALVICNPGNPCGSVYTSQHLKKLARLASKLRVPIISDEIYANTAFDGSRFVPMGAFASDVPVLSVGGISKRWFVPGWRLGWICVCDPHTILKQAKVVDAFTNLGHMQLSTATPVQAALPTILRDTPPAFFNQTLNALSKAADFCYRRAQRISGLSCPSKPQGSMYIMVRVDCKRFKDLSNDLEFAKLLSEEEALAVLPGSAFGYPGWIRLMFAAPVEVLEETWDRIEAFYSSCVALSSTLVTSPELKVFPLNERVRRSRATFSAATALVSMVLAAFSKELM